MLQNFLSKLSLLILQLFLSLLLINQGLGKLEAHTKALIIIHCNTNFCILSITHLSAQEHLHTSSTVKYSAGSLLYNQDRNNNHYKINPPTDDLTQVCLDFFTPKR